MVTIVTMVLYSSLFVLLLLDLLIDPIAAMLPLNATKHCAARGGCDCDCDWAKVPHDSCTVLCYICVDVRVGVREECTQHRH